MLSHLVKGASAEFSASSASDGANDFPHAGGIDRIHGNNVGAGCARADDNHRSRKHCNIDFIKSSK